MKPYFIMMIGLPASGKSTKAKELSNKYNAIIHSSDNLRNELFEDINEQGNNDDLFAELHKRIKNDLRNGQSVIYDATNINYKRRKAFLSELTNIDCTKIAYVVATPFYICVDQNLKRERRVPEHVIKKMYMNFQIPYWYEGWDDIEIDYCKRNYIQPLKFIWQTKYYNQYNKHHELSLGEHCLQCGSIVENGKSDYDLYVAALIHDNGKLFTQTFQNTKGDITEEAHYYQHHCVGSYDSLFYMTDGNKLRIATLILWHMQPYFWENDEVNGEKQMNKYKELWGTELFDDIMMLHNADKLAH